MREILQQLLQRQDLSSQQSAEVTEALLAGMSEAQAAAFLVLLRAKGETAAEILGVAQTMRQHMLPVSVDYPVMDIVGTGGDGANTVNISTAASLVAATLGVKLVKHGNRSVSSSCGSADVLQALGVNIELTPAQVVHCVDQVGMGFCYAPLFHPAMKALKEVRKNLAIRTCFNMLGPLLNPAKADYMLLGVYDADVMPLMAEVLCQLEVTRAMVVHSAGTDEITTAAVADVLLIESGCSKALSIDPSEYGFSQCQLNELRGGDAATNAKLLQEIFSGVESAMADTVMLNAGIAAYLFGMCESIEQGITLARSALKDGSVNATLKKLITVSNEVD